MGEENERRSSLRPASKKKEKRVNQRKTARKRREEIVEKKQVKKKRGRKRKYNEAMDDDDKEQEDENEDDAEKENVNKRRRIKRKKDDDEKEQDVDFENEEDGYSEKECKAHLKSAWEMVEELHSLSDFTPWIAMFYFSMRRQLEKKGVYEENELTKMVATAFHMKQTEVLEHLSEFVEIENERKNPKKKRKS